MKNTALFLSLLLPTGSFAGVQSIEYSEAGRAISPSGITTTGAITCGGALNVSGVIDTSGNTGSTHWQHSTSQTTSISANLVNLSGQSLFGTERSAGGNLITGSLPYSSVYGSNGRAVHLGVSQVDLTISPQHYVGIGDSTPDAVFEVLSATGALNYVVSISSQSDVVGSLFGVTGGGNVIVSSSAYLGIGVGSGNQLFYCAGGTFDGNICRGFTTCICTAGTATPLSIYVK